MGLGTGVPDFEPTLFVLPQERAECGLCACMPALPKDPWGEDTPEPPGKVRAVGRKGRGGADRSQSLGTADPSHPTVLVQSILENLWVH